ncbi:reverse transcriptase family protein [Microbacterium murale]|uniref:RNA-directed DNA polymerase n=1 Tax=Microbacterium murale TaxID=1081040 RepID=A0ABU0P7Z0_9MICO|nr:reverse transcriptase family protein [Microbacterium murale]MDQ0643450.1 RNA-directed DNA polymerase [Microbacterium murale]
MTEAATVASRVLARKPRPSSSAVAAALADAFLAADVWATGQLIESGAYVMGARRRWLLPLVGDVMSAFVRPPHDAPRLLTSLIFNAPAFQEAVRKADERRSPLRVHHHVLSASASREMSGALPSIDSIRDLAALLALDIGQLQWFADTKHWNRRARPGPLHHYRYEWRTRPGRIPRLLEVPEQRLRRVQSTLLSSVLALIPANDAAHGFIPGRSAATGAARHIGSDAVISLDLTTFFARVTAGRVYGTLRQSGYSESVAHIITGLCTNAVPPWALAAMPSGGSPDERFALRRALATSHLPQGAPSSPMLANLAIRRLDSRLAGWAESVDATYTRYADDLAFSGGRALAKRADAFVRGAERIIEDEGHSVNARKTRVRRQGVRQTVTGIVVNQHVNISRSEYDRLKATIHNCVMHGPTSQNRRQIDDFRAHLLGRISWVESLNSSRGERLREEFARIRW